MKNHKNVVYKKLNYRATVMETENMAIKMATGEFIAQACVDDRHSPHYLETLAKHLHYSSDIDLVYTDCYQTTKPNETFEENSSNGNFYEHSRNKFSRENMIKCLPGPMPMWRKSIHDKAGFFNEDLAYAGDWDMFLRMVESGAQFKKVDITKAMKAPGVVSILTGADIANDKIGGLIAGWRIKSEDGSDMKVPAHPPLANEIDNYVGDHVAVVIADSLDEARNAAEFVKVDYKILKAEVDTKDAMGSDQIYKDIPKNLCFDWLLGDRAKVKEAFEKADKIIKIDLINNRVIPNAMEPRAANADYNPSTEEISLYTTSQNPHLARISLR